MASDNPPGDVLGEAVDHDGEEHEASSSLLVDQLLDEIDDDDMDFEPASEDEDEEADFLDAVEDLEGGIELEFAENVSGNGNENGEEQAEGDQAQQEENRRQAQTVILTRDHLQRLLRSQPILRRILRNHNHALGVDDGDDDEDEDDFQNGYGGWRRRRRRGPKTPVEERYPKIPSEAGGQLMNSGLFGARDPWEGGEIIRKKKVARDILFRELGITRGRVSPPMEGLMSQKMIPSTTPDTIIHYDHRCYSGQFSNDGNFFFSCTQHDFRVRMYDTSNPYHWKYYKTVHYPNGQWTITDASLSPDNRLLAYSSIRSMVCLAQTDPEVNAQPMHLDFSNLRGSQPTRGFGIWSIRFSGDGKEIVAGTSDHSVYVYDLETGQSVLKIAAHHDDVNAVCYGDESSPHILYSGSDDYTIKVWDRRSLQDRRCAGAFLGHTEGLTYVDSKGDGRYVLSNSKDQTMKLWDLRRMMTNDQYENYDMSRVQGTGFDYRGEDDYDEDDFVPHDSDCSVVTFRGHKVLKTLIRCHFGPSNSTNSRYVYTGSRDGSVYIYNMDATIAGTIDVKAATRNSRPRARQPRLYAWDEDPASEWQTCVRDVSWHPSAPVIAATAWNGYGMGSGSCSVHSWADGAVEDDAEPKMGVRVDERLEHAEDLYETTVAQRAQRAARAGLRPGPRRDLDE